jgi:hypothetical protein
MTTLPEILPAAGLLIAKATFILAVAGMVAFALRRGTAAARHAAWALALGGIVALPLVAGVVPSLPVSFLPALAVEQGTGAESAGAAVEVSRPALPPMSGLLLSTVAEGAAPLREPALASPIPGELSAASVAVRLWLAGLIPFTAIALVLPPEDARVRAAIRDMEARISSPDVQARVAEVETRLAEFDGSARIAAVQQQLADLDAPRRVRELMERMEARMLRLRSLLAPPR